jgi:hypothetical protein
LLTGIGLLLLYWALMTLVPIPDGYAPNLDMETNLAAWFDRTILTTNQAQRKSACVAKWAA